MYILYVYRNFIMASSEASSNTCYMCLSEETHGNKFMTESPCDCKGTINIHWRCFTQYRKTNPKCGICKKVYTFLCAHNTDYWNVFYKDITIRKEYNYDGELSGEGPIINGKKHGFWKEVEPYSSCNSEGLYKWP